MPYITSADLELVLGRERLLQMTDPDNTGTVQEEIVAEAIKGAESKLNGYLVKRYKVPITAVPLPELVRQLAIDGTIYKLRTRGKSMATAEEIEEERERVQTMKDIASGTIALDIDPGPEKSSLVVDKAGPTPSVSPKLAARLARRGIW